jgi:hypothetical protein
MNLMKGLRYIDSFSEMNQCIKISKETIDAAKCFYINFFDKDLYIYPDFLDRVVFEKSSKDGKISFDISIGPFEEEYDISSSKIEGCIYKDSFNSMFIY